MVDYTFTSRNAVNVERRTEDFDSGWLLSEMHRATGSVNFPALLNKLETKTGQVRNLMFYREGIGNKSFRNTKADNSTALAGPGVSFGYEDGTNTTTETTGTAPKGGAAGSLAVNTKYHNEYPDMSLFPLKALQTPITSYSGNQGRVGYREEGKCKFYLPSRGYLKNYTSFANEFNFRQIEPQDIFIDVDRISWAFGSVTDPPAPNMHPATVAAKIQQPLGTTSENGLGHLGGGSGGITYYGPGTNYNGMNHSRLLTGADCKRLRVVLRPNYGLHYNSNYDQIDVNESATIKKYTYNNAYDADNLGTTANTWISTVGLAYVYMKLEIPDEAAVDNSSTGYASRASDDKPRTYTNRREVYGHWTFTAPDNTYYEQKHRSSGSLSGDGYWTHFDWMLLPVKEPFVLDLPFYDNEVGDTRTINIYGRKYIATWGVSTRAVGLNFGQSSSGNNTWTTRWSDGTQNETSAGQVGGSWDIERVVYDSSGNNFGEVTSVNLGFVRNGGPYDQTRYSSTVSQAASGSNYTIPAGIPLQKLVLVNNGSGISVGDTTIAYDGNTGSDPSDLGSESRRDSNGLGKPIFNSSGQLIGHVESATDTVITLQAGSLVALNDNTQITALPRIGVAHWVEDILNDVPELTLEEMYLYEDTEWVVDSIKDYRDEYQQVNCTKIRGSRHSRRLANG